jgi:two-component system OmpR family response regulator
MEQINKKILVVEDDENFRSILEIKFISEGFFVVVAKDGEEGMVVAEREKPDLIFLDIEMPNMDGLTMAKKLKESNVKVPIIFLTNMKDDEHISDAIEIVPETEYIVKADLNIDDIVERAKKKLGVK